MAMPVRIDDYMVLRVLGRGGQGEVYAARSSRGESVALKLLHKEIEANPENRSRIEREIVLASTLDHPGVVPLIDHGLWQNRRYLVTRLIAGEDLATRLARRGRLGWSEALELLAEVAAGLAAIHAAGMIHRDIKPANILIDRSGSTWIVDLGLARRTAVDRTPLTADGMLIGTPHYMAPEQIATPHAIDGRADCYALGVVLYRCLSGGFPFDGTNSIAILRRHLEAPPPDIRHAVADVPPAVGELLARLLAKEPKARPAAVELVPAMRALTEASCGGTAIGMATTQVLDPATAVTDPAREPLRAVTMPLVDGSMPGTLADGGIPGTLPDGSPVGTLADGAGPIPATIPDSPGGAVIPATVSDQVAGPTLLVQENGGRRLYVYGLRSVVAGRDARERGTDLCLRLLPSADHTGDNRRISGRHAAFEFADGAWRLRDLHSTAGTTLDGRQLHPQAVVAITDDVELVLAGVLRLRCRPRGVALWLDRLGNTEDQRYLLVAGDAAIAPGADGLLDHGDADRLRWTTDGPAWADGSRPAAGAACDRCPGAAWRGVEPGDQK